MDKTEISTRFDRLEQKLDRNHEAIAKVREAHNVHAALCDSDRETIKKEQAVQRNKIWKIVLLSVGASGGGVGAFEVIRMFAG